MKSWHYSPSFSVGSAYGVAKSKAPALQRYITLFFHSLFISGTLIFSFDAVFAV